MDDTINRLVGLREQLQKKRDKFRQRLEEVEKQLESVTVTLQLLRDGQNGEVLEYVQDTGLLEEIRGKTQLQALIAVAKKNDGRVKITDAREKLILAKVMKPGKNAYNILYNVIVKSEKFKHVGPGEYELLSAVERPRLPLLKSAGG